MPTVLPRWPLPNGWLTHNEKDPWGADHYAHIDPGYIVKKAEGLSGINAEFAHRAVEVAVDLLLKNEDPQLGRKAAEMPSNAIPGRTVHFSWTSLFQMKTGRID